MKFIFIYKILPWASIKYLEDCEEERIGNSCVQWPRHVEVDWQLFVGRHESLPTPQTLLSYKAKFKTTWGRTANLLLSGPRQRSIRTKRIVAEKKSSTVTAEGRIRISCPSTAARKFGCQGEEDWEYWNRLIAKTYIHRVCLDWVRRAARS